MREILFRAKAINRDPDGEHRTNYQNGDWVYGLLVKKWNEKFPNLPAEMTNENGISGIEVDHKTIGQYTGLTDKNGERIFEGDILKVKRHLYEVVWTDGCLYAKQRNYLKGNVTRYCLISGLCEQGAKVIGNIYDNPELLKGVK